MSVVEDNAEYNRFQITELLRMIDEANKRTGGLTELCSAYGILGFIRFLHGYYLMLITKRRRVGMIGSHVIYGIEDLSYVYIPPSFPKQQASDFTDENRYHLMGVFMLTCRVYKTLH